MSDALSLPRVRTEVFKEIMEDAYVKRIDPRACVPFCKLRKLSEFGVRRLMLSFSESGEGDAFNSGITTSGNVPTVVPLGQNCIDIVLNDLVNDLKMTDEMAKDTVPEFNTWYGIIDGQHRNEALRRLADQDSSHFKGFSWSVLVLMHGTTAELRAFARNCNEKQDPKYIVSPTVYDVVNSLQ